MSQGERGPNHTHKPRDRTRERGVGGGRERQQQGRRRKEGEGRWDMETETEVRVRTKTTEKERKKRIAKTPCSRGPAHPCCCLQPITGRSLPGPEPRDLCWGLSSLSKTSSPHFQLWPPSPPSRCPSRILHCATAWPALSAFPGHFQSRYQLRSPVCLHMD